MGIVVHNEYYTLVEDPSEEFVRLRDYVDCANCIKLLPNTFGSREAVTGGFQPEMHQQAQKEMKICKRQVSEGAKINKHIYGWCTSQVDLRPPRRR